LTLSTRTTPSTAFIKETDGDSEGVREEMETLKWENQELKSQFEAQGAQFVEMKRKIMQLQQIFQSQSHWSLHKVQQISMTLAWSRNEQPKNVAQLVCM
jgi:predicted nuclease with TOPRIM domain